MAITGKQERIIHLHLLCRSSPLQKYMDKEKNTAGSVVCGIQDRQQNIHSGQAHPDGSLSYRIDAIVKRKDETDGVRFSGPYVHGTATAPFLYLSLKQADAEPSSWIRRLKIPLPTLTWQQVEMASHPMSFSACIQGTGSGTVPLLDAGWVQLEQ